MNALLAHGYIEELRQEVSGDNQESYETFEEVQLVDIDRADMALPSLTSIACEDIRLAPVLREEEATMKTKRKTLTQKIRSE